MMPSLPPLLLHELFPQFPPLWFILLSGAILGVGLAAFSRMRRRHAFTTLAEGTARPRREPDLPASPFARRVREIRETLGDEILGVPWSIPGYALVLVLGGGLASLVIPPLGIALLPGYIALWAVALSAPGGGPTGLLGDVLAIGIMVGFSWAFWTGAAMFGWHLLRILRRDPVPDRRVRLDLGRRSQG